MHDGKAKETGRPATSKRKAIPACRCDGGSWWWRVDAPDAVTGRRKQMQRGQYPTKEAALDGLDDIRQQLRRGVIADDGGHTVKTWLEEWLIEGIRDGSWEPTTADGYRRDVDAYLSPMLGHLRLRDLQRAHVASMLTELAKPDETRTSRKGMRGGSAVVKRSPSTIDRVRRTLRSALGAALLDDKIGHNPAAGKFKATAGRTQHAASWWQPDELQLFLDHVTDDPDVALWTLIAMTGLRRSEALGLRWTDVDMDGRQPGLLVMQRCLAVNGLHPCGLCGGSHRGRMLRPGAKSEAGARWVPLVSLVVVEMEAHREKQREMARRLGDHWSEHGLVFPQGDRRRSMDLPGAPRRPDEVTKRHEQLVSEVALPTIVLHEMRHGAVSLLAAAGMPVDQIALIVGHSTQEVTKAIYLHGVKSTLAVHAKAAADLLKPQAPPGGSARPNRSDGGS